MSDKTQDDIPQDLIWYHTIDLGRGVVTRGIYDHRPYLKQYGFPSDLRGKTVLDVGAASGFFSFEFERRGGTVTATDLPGWMDHDFAPEYEPDLAPAAAESYLRDPFLFARSRLGSRVEKKEINIYDLSPDSVGMYDLVFCGSLLLHLTDPVRALWRLRSVTRPGGTAVLVTAIHEDPSAEPRAVFVGNAKAFTWWLPNRVCFEFMVGSAGFSSFKWVSQFHLDFADGRRGHLHGVIHARP